MKLPLYAGPERHGELIARPTANFSQSMSNTERNMTPGVRNNWVLPCRKLSGHQVMLSSNSQPHIVPKLIFGRDVGHDGLP